MYVSKMSYRHKEWPKTNKNLTRLEGSNPERLLKDDCAFTEWKIAGII